MTYPREPDECPYCHRVMSIREVNEQGACNECYEDALAVGWALDPVEYVDDERTFYR